LLSVRYISPSGTMWESRLGTEKMRCKTCVSTYMNRYK
jgi:hypothetical protein